MKATELSVAMQLMATKMEDVTDETYPECGEYFAFYLQNSHLMVFEGNRFDKFLPLEMGENCERRLTEYAESLGESYNAMLTEVTKSGGDIEKPPTPHLYFADIDNLERCGNNAIVHFWERFEREYCQTLKAPPPGDGQSMFYHLWTLLDQPTAHSHAKAVKDILTFKPKEFNQRGAIAKWAIAVGIADGEPVSFDEAFDKFMAEEQGKADNWKAELAAAEKEVWEEAYAENVPSDDPIAERDRRRAAVIFAGKGKEPPFELRPESNKIDRAVANGLIPAQPAHQTPQLPPSLEEQFTQEVEDRQLDAPRVADAEEKPGANLGTPRPPRRFLPNTGGNPALAKAAAIAGDVIAGLVLWAGYLATGFLCAALSGNAAALVSSVWFPIAGAAVAAVAVASAKGARRKNK